MKRSCTSRPWHFAWRLGSHSWISSRVWSTSETMDSGATADCPSLPWRAMSNMTMWGVAGLCRTFLSCLSNAEIHGGEAFMALLDSRQNPSQRSKGLITGIYIYQSRSVRAPTNLFVFCQCRTTSVCMSRNASNKKTGGIPGSKLADICRDNQNGRSISVGITANAVLE